jgi:uncharacterized Zn-finger protein
MNLVFLDQIVQVPDEVLNKSHKDLLYLADLIREIKRVCNQIQTYFSSLSSINKPITKLNVVIDDITKFFEKLQLVLYHTGCMIALTKPVLHYFQPFFNGSNVRNLVTRCIYLLNTFKDTKDFNESIKSFLEYNDNNDNNEIDFVKEIDTLKKFAHDDDIQRGIKVNEIMENTSIDFGESLVLINEINHPNHLMFQMISGLKNCLEALEIVEKILN